MKKTLVMQFIEAAEEAVAHGAFGTGGAASGAGSCGSSAQHAGGSCSADAHRSASVPAASAGGTLPTGLSTITERGASDYAGWDSGKSDSAMSDHPKERMLSSHV